MTRRIITIRGKGRHILRKVCAPCFDDATAARVAQDLRDTIFPIPYAAGLSAPQIGESFRIFAVKYAGDVTIYIKPVELRLGGDFISAPEGCLSLPGTVSNVFRRGEITINYLDERGEMHTERARGFRARVIQHEMDHLDGILMTDKEGAKARRPA